MKKIAILIGLEKYASSSFAGIEFAANDIAALSQVLKLHGFSEENQLLLQDVAATRKAILAKVPQLLNELQEEDQLIFFYAGSVYSIEGEPSITCFDTQAKHLQKTSIPLARLFPPHLGSSPGNRVLLLDGRIESDAKSSLTHLEFPSAKILKAVGCGACLTACRPGEKSYRSRSLQHGIWISHLIDALQGNAPLALKRGELTPSSLQKYLVVEVPRTLRKTFEETKEQAPQLIALADTAFVIADLRPLLKQRKNAAKLDSSHVIGLSFTSQKSMDVRRMSGWRKSLRVPELVNGTTASFVAELAATEVQADLDKIHSALKEAFHYVRRDLHSSSVEEGAGTIITPHFNYSVSVLLNPDNAGEVVWTRTVDSIRGPESVMSGAFSSVFDEMFDTLELSLPQKIQVEDFIDAVEAASIPQLKISYDRQATYCDLQIRGSKVAVRISERRLAVIHRQPEATRRLIQSLEAVTSFVQKHNLPLLTATRQKSD